jgi:hypothetical protein
MTLAAGLNRRYPALTHAICTDGLGLRSSVLESDAGGGHSEMTYKSFARHDPSYEARAVLELQLCLCKLGLLCRTGAPCPVTPNDHENL